jgi:DnaJ-like protein
MPLGMVAERKIREAIEAGEFDRLPNAGQPISLDQYFSFRNICGWRTPFSRTRTASLKKCTC